MKEIDYVALYRECHDMQDYLRLVREAGGDEEEAVALYTELNAKYGGQ